MIPTIFKSCPKPNRKNDFNFSFNLNSSKESQVFHIYILGPIIILILLKPITGRRHQLRVHLSELGFCIVGDYTYSQRSDISPPRMFLHAFRLVLPNSIENLDILTTDPFTEKRLKYNRKKCIVYNKLPHAFDLIDAV
jgi:23S rRNA-/tRNA-specific pseudouridylate synthase